MRRLGFVWLVVCASCRPNSRLAPADAAPPDGPAEGSIGATPAFRFGRPVAAARGSRAIGVVARDRATGELAFAKMADGAATVTGVLKLPPGLVDPEVVASAAGFGLLARETGDAGEGRVLLRVAAGEGSVGSPAPIGTAVCASDDGVYAMAREKNGWTGSFFPLDDAKGEPASFTLSGGSEATIVCGQHRAFAALGAPGELRAVAWMRTTHADRPTVLPRATTAGAEEDTAMAAMDDALVVVKLEQSIVHTLVWKGEGASVWQKSDPLAKDGLALEAVDAEKGKIGLLLLRTIPKVKGCPAGETADVVAEVAVVDAASGKLVRAPESIETWKCGAEPGPFFSGWAGGKLVVGWPRGADVACARAGVKRGGIGYAEVDPASGRARVGRVARPAETIAPAGCDATQCYAVGLTRGADPCGAIDGPESGRLEVFAYP